MKGAGSIKARLRFSDVVSSAKVGLLLRPGRTLMTSLGISLGVAALVGIVGVAHSNRLELLSQIDALGTNFMQVEPATDVNGESVPLPVAASGMIKQLPGVQSAAAATTISAHLGRTAVDATPYALEVLAVEEPILRVVEGQVEEGVWLDQVGDLPMVVLGAEAARALGIESLDASTVVGIGTGTYQVVGILRSLPIHPQVDAAALVSRAAGERYFDSSSSPSWIVVRTNPEEVGSLLTLLPEAANPLRPGGTRVLRPTDALAARSAVDTSLQRLLLALGAITVVVATLGVGNTMSVAMLERRSEIGLRRALGAKRTHIAAQFLVEALLISLGGGVVGLVLGIGATVLTASVRGHQAGLPVQVAPLALGVSIVVGVAAGLAPAVQASRLNPADAIRPQ